MKPIHLSAYNEALEQYPGEEYGDQKALSGCIGVHLHCNGFVDLMMTSNTHDVILCRRCGLRVVIPRGLETYGDLRRYMQSVLHKQ